MELRFSTGGLHPTIRIEAGREHPKIQMEHQRLAPFGMEPARREEQRWNGLHHPSSHRNRYQCSEHTEQTTLALENPRPHTRYEQQHRVHHPDTQLAEENKHREHSAAGPQEQLSKPPHLSTGGKEKTIH